MITHEGHRLAFLSHKETATRSHRTLGTATGGSHEVPTNRPDLVLKETEEMVATPH
ncbi:hypothetical protein OG440_21630 [Streptomyces sp. NBC_00637]|uniref:hypothetical protein n=1 Tax=Streptomyces sp. NBC_00637 TaxID=2903667 RepID=UPI0032493656